MALFSYSLLNSDQEMVCGKNDVKGTVCPTHEGQATCEQRQALGPAAMPSPGHPPPHRAVSAHIHNTSRAPLCMPHIC